MKDAVLQILFILQQVVFSLKLLSRYGIMSNN